MEVNREPYTIGAVREWLFQMPLHLVEDVVRVLLSKVETIVHEDKDCKLILTLINIDRTRPSDFFFGVHSLFRVLATTDISKIPFSTKTWFCLWEFEQLTTCNHLLKVMIDSFPLMSCLAQVNLAYIATDKLLCLMAKYCRQLEELNVDHCQITDKGIKLISDRPRSEAAADYYGCKHLQYVSIQGNACSFSPMQLYVKALFCSRMFGRHGFSCLVSAGS